jgi:hypothetical protein
MMFPDAVDRARHEMCHAVIEILQGGTVDRITLSQCAVFPRCCPAGDLLRFSLRAFARRSSLEATIGHRSGRCVTKQFGQCGTMNSSKIMICIGSLTSC